MTTGANEAIARLFEAYADVLEARGDDYRPRSYRRAAENIRGHPESVEALAAEGVDAVREIEGVGESIAEKVLEFAETGEVAAIEAAREEFPVDMAGLTSVEGVGPRTVGDLYEGLGVTTIDGLEAAAREGDIRELDGYGETTEANILEGIAFARRAGERERLGDARHLAEEVIAHLEGCDAVERCAATGSLRRWCETVGDVDVLAAGADRAAIVDRLRSYDGVTDEVDGGRERASVRADGTRIDLRIVDADEWGSALQSTTGSADHNARLRTHATERGYEITERGVFDADEAEATDPAGSGAGERIAGETEAAVYAALGLQWVPPELREADGEIEAARAGTLPDLLDPGAVRGDLHVHTSWSDGDRSIAEMAAAAASFGHDYVCIADHAAGPGVVGGMGLDDGELLEQREAVRAVDADVDGDIDVLAGVEANIDADGGISVGDDVLAALDVVVASPHSGLDGDGTDRLVAAVEHPHVDLIGHPTGRLLTRRRGMTLDVETVASAAARHGVALEVNANPHRLDLGGEAVRTALEAGATIAVNTDAHRPAAFEYVRYGVHTARRGWAEPPDVLNAWTLEDLRAFVG